MDDNKVKSIIESMLFVWGEPLDYKIIADTLELEKSYIRKCCEELKEEYQDRGKGILIQETNGKFQFCTPAENYSYIQDLCAPVKEKKLSQAALEVLAIIAYKQPITKAEIDTIRGVKSDRVVENLKIRQFIEEKGIAEKIGRPILYGTTDLFLNKFGFENLKDMPSIDEIENVVTEDKIEYHQMVIDWENDKLG